jgi:hypothetical protein
VRPVHTIVRRSRAAGGSGARATQAPLGCAQIRDRNDRQVPACEDRGVARSQQAEPDPARHRFVGFVGVGDVAGWDAAGTVIATAADGSGPRRAARVVTFGWGGAWAQPRVVDTTQLAVLPDSVEFVAAAALPVAAVTALRAVRRLGPLLGLRILITGASGGVARFGFSSRPPPARNVVAVVGRRERGAGLTELGAAQGAVVVGGLTGRSTGRSTTSAGRCWPTCTRCSRPPLQP